MREVLEPEFEVGAVEDGRALLEVAGRFQPDVILADISMPFLNGIDAVRELTTTGSRSNLIILTMHSGVSMARAALEAARRDTFSRALTPTK